MKLHCHEFESGGAIPSRFSQAGGNRSLPIQFSELPEGTQSLVLLLEEPHAARAPFTHWLVYNLDPTHPEVRENELPACARVGQNDAGTVGYSGPNPLVGDRTYRLRAFALDQRLCKPSGAIREEIEQAIAGHVLAEAELIGHCCAPEIASEVSARVVPMEQPGLSLAAG